MYCQLDVLCETKTKVYLKYQLNGCLSVYVLFLKKNGAIISFLTENSKLNGVSYSHFVWVLNHMNLCTLVHLNILRESFWEYGES